MIKDIINNISNILTSLLNKSTIMLKPNFLIPGAGLSGTTTLYDYLKQHPEIFLSDPKEPNFFSNYYELGEKWYLQNFKSTNPYSAVGEASTQYFVSKFAPKRIHAFNPKFKFIFILRNPIERAFSSYKYDIQFLGESRTFEEIITKNAKYITDGMYYTHISRFLKYFSKKMMFFIIFEKFVKDEFKYLKKLCEFLNVDPKFQFDSDFIDKNPSRMPISTGLQKINNRFFNSHPSENIFLRALKFNLRININRINHMHNRRDFPKMKEITRRYLINYYKNETLNLEDLINKDLSNWLN